MRGKFEKAAAAMPVGLDGILLSSQVNTFYTTGFAFEDGYVLVTRDATYLLCDPRYFEASARAEGVERVELTGDALPSLVADIGIKTLGFEDRELTVAAHKRLSDRLVGVELVPVGGLLDSLRAKKDADELLLIEQAQELTDAAFEHIISYIRRGVTERQVALELEWFMRKNGSDGTAFQTIAVSGKASSVPHGTPSDAPLRDGFLTMDFGAKFGGYCSDMTRTVVIGRADDRLRDIYDTVLKAQLHALESIAPGKRTSDIDREARDIIDERYPHTFTHSLGHGVGVYIHESPSLSPSRDGVLEVGNVVTVEPGIYISGECGCRIEDMVAVTESGIRNFTKSPKALIEIY